MEIVLFLWLAGIVDSVKGGITAGAVISALVLFMAIPIMHVEVNRMAYHQTWWKITYWISICAIIREMSPIVNVFYIVVGFVLHSFWDFC